MRVLRVRTVAVSGAALLLVAIAVLDVAPRASAAPAWKAPMTVANARGIPDPMVAVDRTGRATIVYSSAPVGSTSHAPTIYSVVRLPGQTFGRPNAVGHGVEPQIAVNPDGATAIAWIDGDRIQLLSQPAPGQLGAAGQSRRSIDVSGTGARSLRLVLDAAGRATLAWLPVAASDAPKEVQLRTVAVAADGTVGTTQELGPPATCERLQLVGNAAGDAAAVCFPGTSVHVRSAGESEFVTETYQQNFLHSQAYVGVDGAGTVTVALPSNSSGWVVLSLVERRRGGSLAPGPTFAPGNGASVPRLFTQESRSVVAWVQGGELRYAVRPAGGDFAAPRTLRTTGRSLAAAFADVSAPLGPLPILMTATEMAVENPSPLDLRGASVGQDGVARLTGSATIPGRADFPGNVAASENGLAVATWEQACGDGFVVMAMVLDERRGATEPPCQDRAAPQVLVRPKRARLAGRTLRFRAGCDESCRLVVRVRVLRQGQGKPLATTKTRRARQLSGSRYGTFKLRLRRADAARVRAALAARRRVTVRFALSVSDSYENGAVRRVAVPLRR
jgi:hypothetical protein